MKRLLPIAFFILSFLEASAQYKFEVFFDFNEDRPNAESAIHLQNWLDSHKDIEIQKIFGFCDSVDANDYNMDLASRRINSVLEILKENRFALSKNMEMKPFGEDFPQSKVQSENRKVSIFYDEFKKPPSGNPGEMLSEQVKKAKQGDLIRLKNMNFHNNSAVMVPKSKPVLFDLLCVLEDNPKLKIEIQGHICCQTEKDINDVSTARARAVYVFLVRNGINRKRLAYKGYGITRPIYPIPEENEEQEDENRRVEIRIVEN